MSEQDSEEISEGSPTKCTPFFETKDKYLVITASCVGNKIKNKLEPFLDDFCKRFPHANIYSKRNDGSKDRPGTIKVLGNGQDQRFIIVCFAQYYPGKNNLPNDSREQRLLWFKKCLEKISKLPNLESVAFPTDIVSDSGGSFESYKQAILDLEQYIKLERSSIKFNIYSSSFDLENPSEKNTQTIKQANQVDRSVNDQKSNVIIGLHGLQKKSYKVEQLCILEVVDHFEQPVKKQIKKIKVKAQTVKKSSPSTQKSLLVQKPLIIEKPKLLQEKAESTSVKKYDENPDWQPLRKLPIHESWNQIFQDPIIQKELDRLESFFEQELEDFGDHIAILPQPANNIFRAFQDPLDRVKVVILGQDPYHSKREEAMGLAFSVPQKVTIPPSLRNIFKELANDIEGFEPPSHGDLTKWTTQGVLLLNTSLTVRQKKPGCHLKEWKNFTDRIITLLASDEKHPRIFLLWGSPAQKKISEERHNRILKAVHPSPLSASRGWFGCQHFSKVNEILKEWNIEPIDWVIE